MSAFLDLVNQKLQMIAGARRLFTVGGKEVKRIDALQNDTDYVASANHFTPMAYGQTLTRSASSFITSVTSPSLAAQTARPSRSSEPRAAKSTGEKRKRAKSHAPPGTAPASTDLTVRIKKLVKNGEKKLEKAFSFGDNGESTKKKVKKRVQNGVDSVKKTGGDLHEGGKKVVRKTKKKVKENLDVVIDKVQDTADGANAHVVGAAAAGGAAIGATGAALNHAVSDILSDKENDDHAHKIDDHAHEVEHHSEVVIDEVAGGSDSSRRTLVLSRNGKPEH
ncbi:unnamed protein product, partial [Mesorhabditis spiculigera]